MLFVPFEPKVSFRFKMYISGIPAYVIKSSNFPNLDQGEIVIDHVNTEFKVKGKSRWQPITITMWDPIDPQASQLVHNWINTHHNSSNGIDGYAFDEYKKDITLEAEDPKQAPIEVWTLYGCWAQTTNWGEGDWTAENAKEIEVQLNYDYAIHG